MRRLLPVSVTGIMHNAYPPQYAYPSAPPVYRVLPQPPRLHWGLVLLLNVVTLGLFGSVWMVVLSHWAKKVSGQKKPFSWALAYVLFFPVIFMVAFLTGALLVILHVDPRGSASDFIGLVSRVGALALYIGATFTLKGELEGSPFDVPLGGVMTFLFGPVYFQYHLQDFQFADAGAGYGIGLAPLNDRAQETLKDNTSAESRYPPQM